MNSPKYNSNAAKEKWLKPQTISPISKKVNTPKSSRRYKGFTSRKNYINTPRHRGTRKNKRSPKAFTLK